MSESVRWLDERQQHAWRQWLRAHCELNSALARQLATKSLSMADYEVLVNLSEATDGRMRATALADSMRWERSRLSHQVTRMSKRGLVRRTECADDGRGAWVEITAEGRRVIADAAPGHVDAVRTHFIEVLTPQQLASLDEITGIVLDSLGKRDDTRG